MIETLSGHVGSVKLPLICDAFGKPVLLTEELAVGSIVRIAVGNDGMMSAVQIIKQEWANSFDDAAD